MTTHTFAKGSDIITVIAAIEDEPVRNNFFRTLAHAALVSAIRSYHSEIQFQQTLDDMTTRDGVDARTEADDAMAATMHERYLNLQTIIERIHADGVLAAQIYKNLHQELSEADERMVPMSAEAMVEFMCAQPRTADEAFVKLKSQLTGISVELLTLIDRQNSLEDLRHMRESAPTIIGLIDSEQTLSELPTIPPVMQIRWASKVCDKVLESAERRIMKARTQERMLEGAKERQILLPECERMCAFIDFVANEHKEEISEAEDRGFTTPSSDLNEKSINATKRNISLVKMQIKAAEEALKVA